MIETVLIHGGKREPLIQGALTSPIFQSSTYASAEWGKAKYIRFGNTPNHEELQARLALLEGAEAALVTSSGMAAIATAMFALLRPGDHVISHNSLYGCTYRLFEETLRPLGIETDYVDMTVDALDLEALRRPTTKAVYLEAISNPTLGIPDFDAVLEFSGRHGLTTLIDNTFATPVNFRPIEAGFEQATQKAAPASTRSRERFTAIWCEPVRSASTLGRKQSLQKPSVNGLRPHVSDERVAKAGRVFQHALFI